MNGREKSDPAIVAEKSPNKTGQPAASVNRATNGSDGCGAEPALIEVPVDPALMFQYFIKI